MKRIAVSAAIVLMIAVSAWALAQAKFTVNGTVTDRAGSPVSGVTVTLTDAQTGKKKTTRTNKSGTYEFTGVPEVFSIIAALSDSSAAKFNVTRAGGPQMQLDLTLDIAPAPIPDKSLPFQIPPPGPRQRDVQITADKVTRDGAAVIHYRGNVEMKTDAVIVHADQLDFDTKTQQADLRGNVTVKVLPVSAKMQPLAGN